MENIKKQSNKDSNFREGFEHALRDQLYLFGVSGHVETAELGDHAGCRVEHGQVVPLLGGVGSADRPMQ